jgi:hypothetical protein
MLWQKQDAIYIKTIRKHKILIRHFFVCVVKKIEIKLTGLKRQGIRAKETTF